MINGIANDPTSYWSGPTFGMFRVVVMSDDCIIAGNTTGTNEIRTRIMLKKKTSHDIFCVWAVFFTELIKFYYLKTYMIFDICIASELTDIYNFFQMEENPQEKCLVVCTIIIFIILYYYTW